MDHDNCTATDHTLCHLNAAARRRWHELMQDGCPEHAEALRTQGVWA